MLPTPERTEIFALTYAQSVGVAEEMGYTRTSSWRKGSYAVTRPSKKLTNLFESHRMTPARWEGLLTGLVR